MSQSGKLPSAEGCAESAAQPTVASGEASVAPFYRPENYSADESIGYLMRRILTAVGQAVELEMSADAGNPTYPQWVPLHKLHMGTATTVAELARECQLDTGAMTRLLDRLEAKSLVRRVRSVADRRVVNIELTDDGRVAAMEVPHVLCRVQNEFLAGFDEAEWKQLKAYLRRILDNSLHASARAAASKEKDDSVSS